MISYRKLWKLLAKRNMDELSFQENTRLSSHYYHRLKGDMWVPLSTIDKICESLECQPGDIMEYIAGDDRYIYRYRRKFPGRIIVTTTLLSEGVSKLPEGTLIAQIYYHTTPDDNLDSFDSFVSNITSCKIKIKSYYDFLTLCTLNHDEFINMITKLGLLTNLKFCYDSLFKLR